VQRETLPQNNPRGRTTTVSVTSSAWVRVETLTSVRPIELYQNRPALRLHAMKAPSREIEIGDGAFNLRDGVQATPNRTRTSSLGSTWKQLVKAVSNPEGTSKATSERIHSTSEAWALSELCLGRPWLQLQVERGVLQRQGRHIGPGLGLCGSSNPWKEEEEEKKEEREGGGGGRKYEAGDSPHRRRCTGSWEHKPSHIDTQRTHRILPGAGTWPIDETD